MKYDCYGIVSGSKYLGIVEAKSEKEAIEKAYNLNTIGVCLCHHCSSECQDAIIVDVNVEKSKE